MTDSAAQGMSKPLKLAVVGHTNVGKTSLLRTLTRDVGFGEVSHRPSTTRHVEGARLSVDGQALLELYDTPGLEDAIALLDYLERLDRPGERLDGPARLARFLVGSEARQRFEQEAKVLRRTYLMKHRPVLYNSMLLSGTLHAETEKTAELMDNVSKLYEELISFSDLYDSASFEAKKMIVNQLIRRVDVYRGYQLIIPFNFDLTPYIEEDDAAAC